MMIEPEEVVEPVVESVAEAPAEQTPEIDIERYVGPLREEISGLRQQLDPDRNAAIARQQAIVQQHRQNLADLRLAAEQGEYEKAMKTLPYFVTAIDQGLASLYQQQAAFAQFQEEVRQRSEVDTQAMAEERYFAARDPEGHAMLAEYPLHVARAIAAHAGRNAPTREDIVVATEFMESRFAEHRSVQEALDEMVGYVRQFKATPQKQPVRRLPTAVPSTHPSSRNSEAQIEPDRELVAAMWG